MRRTERSVSVLDQVSSTAVTNVHPRAALHVWLVVMLFYSFRGSPSDAPRLGKKIHRFLALPRALLGMNGYARCIYCIDEDLLAILRGKLKSEELMAGVESLMAAAAVLRQRRLTASHFGNGGEVANLLSEAKLRKEKRRGDGSIASRQALGRPKL